MIAISVCEQAVSAFAVLETDIASEGDCDMSALNMLVDVVHRGNERALCTVPHTVSFYHF